jgi:hypothetical protein
LFDHADGLNWQNIEHSYAKTVDQGHGRVETRECWVLGNLEIIKERGACRDLNAVVRVRGTRTLKGVTSVEDRLFITSLPVDAARVMRAVWFHWGIERERPARCCLVSKKNGLHWVLDVQFDEDDSRVRAGNAQANLVAVRHLALSVLKRDVSVKGGVGTKRFRAGLDEAYLLRLLKS